MTNQPEALRVAEDLEQSRSASYTRDRNAARLLRAQHAEIERLREQLRLANIDALNEISAEIERLRVDAERYRWLRDWQAGTHDIVPMTGRYCDTPILREELDLAIDAAIDAAMGGKP